MAALVAPGCARFTVNAVYSGQPVANIIDMQVDTTGSPETREQALFDAAGDIINNWDDHVRALLCAPYVAQSVSWVDLNSLDGSTGERSTTSDTTWPAVGGSAAQAFPGSVALRIDKRQDGGRRARNGRMYLVGINEGGQGNGTNNTWDGGILTTFNTAMAAFLSGINDQLPGSDVQKQMVVIHTVDGAFVSYSDVTALQANPLVASQRRRLNW